MRGLFNFPSNYRIQPQHRPNPTRRTTNLVNRTSSSGHIPRADKTLMCPPRHSAEPHQRQPGSLGDLLHLSASCREPVMIPSEMPRRSAYPVRPTASGQSRHRTPGRAAQKSLFLTRLYQPGLESNSHVHPSLQLVGVQAFIKARACIQRLRLLFFPITTSP